MKKTDLLLILLFLIGMVRISYAQDFEKQTKINIDLTQKTSNWVLYDNSHGLEVSYKVEDCQSPNTGILWRILYFKITNPTPDKEYHIIWDFRKYNGDECLNCYQEDYEDSINLIIGPGETYVNDCSYPNKNNLGIYLGSDEYPEEPWTDAVVLENYNISFLRTIKTANHEE